MSEYIDVWVLEYSGEDGRAPSRVVAAFSSEQEAKRNKGMYNSISHRKAIVLADGRSFLVSEEIDLDGKYANLRKQRQASALSKLTEEEKTALFGDNVPHV